MMEGWICPDCGRVYSPYVTECEYCNDYEEECEPCVEINISIEDDEEDKKLSTGDEVEEALGTLNSEEIQTLFKLLRLE